jgi:hypothetical protein
MANRVPVALVLSGFLASAALPAAAIDQPISGKRLVVQRTGTMEKLSFTSKDAAFLFPAVGSDDDPGTGSPGGALLEIISVTEPTVAFVVPPGVGTPGWQSTTGAIPTHRWKNPSAPGGPSAVKLVRLRQGKVLKVLSKQAGLALAAPTPRVGIRVTTGSLTNCALIVGASIRTNAAGKFVGVNAPAPALLDCSEASLRGLPACGSATFPECAGACGAGETCTIAGFSGCHCVGPATPCGQSNPTCGGTCPAGEECVSFGLAFPLNNCGCLPIGSTPCGSPGPPACGGDCPAGAGTGCGAIFSPPSLGGGVICDCVGPGQSCANGFAWGGAPSEGFPFQCYPIICSGTYPTCGGACQAGGVCSPFAVAETFSGCICAVPAPCGAGGFECPPGEVCKTPGVCGPP